MRSQRLVVLVASVLLSACSQAGDTDRRVPPDTPAVRVDTTAADSPGPGHAAVSWMVTPTGAGTARIGMSTVALAPMSSRSADTASIGDGCGYLKIDTAPDSMRFMVEGRELVRIEVAGAQPATAEGARVGDSEQQILALYPKARRLPHKYTDGSYLIVLPGAPADTMHRYVFETDGKRVTAYRAGRYPQVEYVEGCS